MKLDFYDYIMAIILIFLIGVVAELFLAHGEIKLNDYTSFCEAEGMKFDKIDTQSFFDTQDDKIICNKSFRVCEATNNCDYLDVQKNITGAWRHD